MTRPGPGSKDRARARETEARERLRSLTGRGRRALDAWVRVADRGIEAVDELADAMLGGKPDATDAALCAFWLGCWSDAVETLHETYAECLLPPGEGSPSDPGKPKKETPGQVVITFEISQDAEAADPQTVPGVSVPQAATLKLPAPLARPGQPAPVIPVANVRVSTYGSRVVLSLVDLGDKTGPQPLPPGVYTGALELKGQPFATVNVTVSSVA